MIRRAFVKNGFTATELVISLGITVILIALAIPVYGNLQTSVQLDENTSQLIQTIRLAREYSLSSYNSARYGVKILPTKYILYQGSSYSLRNNQYDRETDLGSALQLNWDLSEGSGEINFTKGLGLPSSTGTIMFIHSSAGQKTVSVNKMGIVEEQ